MKKTVSIQGVKGAFHYMAAQKYFGSNIEVLECKDFKSLIESVENGVAGFGVMAIENSLVGNILQNYTLLRESSVCVVGEVYLRIVQNLLALPGETVESIKEIHSHYMALAQCENYLKKRWAVKIVSTGDTAQSAKHIAANQLKGVAAIGSIEAAKEYGLDVLEYSIETNKSNFTRFLVLAKTANEANLVNANKASIVFGLPHQPGSLHKALQILYNQNINLTMLQSLPQVGYCWEYYFHADLVFNTLNDFNHAQSSLQKHTKYFKTIGIYRSGSLETEN
jgi:prephenate dehydratase